VAATKPGQIRGGAAAESDDDVVAREARVRHRVPARGEDLGGLRALRIGNLDEGDGPVEAGGHRARHRRHGGGVDERDAVSVAEQTGQTV